MKFIATVMFDNHTFGEAGGTLSEMRSQLKKLYADTYEFPGGYKTTGKDFVAGWGRVRVVGDACRFELKFPSSRNPGTVTSGLLRFEDIDRCLTPAGIKAALALRKMELQEAIAKDEERLKRLKEQMTTGVHE